MGKQELGEASHLHVSSYVHTLMYSELQLIQSILEGCDQMSHVNHLNGSDGNVCDWLSVECYILVSGIDDNHILISLVAHFL